MTSIITAIVTAACAFSFLSFVSADGSQSSRALNVGTSAPSLLDQSVKTTSPSLQAATPSIVPVRAPTGGPTTAPSTKVSHSPSIMPDTQSQFPLDPFELGLFATLDLNQTELASTMEKFLFDSMIQFPLLDSLQKITVVVEKSKPSQRSLSQPVDRSLLQYMEISLIFSGTAYFDRNASGPTLIRVQTAEGAALFDSAFAFQDSVSNNPMIGSDVQVTYIGGVPEATPSPTPATFTFAPAHTDTPRDASMGNIAFGVNSLVSAPSVLLLVAMLFL